jgi:F-type H+-transporting ATPase subunit b
VSLLAFSGGADAALLLQEEAAHAEKFLGLPLWIWQLVNLILFFAVLLYFVARPMTEAFRRRQREVEERNEQARRHRSDVQRLATEIRERTARLEREIEEIRSQGRIDGESARAALAERADQEAERVRAQAAEEIERLVVAARDELKRTAADVTGAAAAEILSREITPQDRERLLADSVERLKSGTR